MGIAADPVVVFLGGSKWIFTTDMVTKSLQVPTHQTTATRSHHDETDTDYQVPTLHTFVVLEVRGKAYDNTTAYAGELDSSSTTDTGGTRILNIPVSNGGTSASTQFINHEGITYKKWQPVFSEIPASNYIVTTGSWAQPKWSKGIEMDS